MQEENAMKKLPALILALLMTLNGRFAEMVARQQVEAGQKENRPE